MDRQHKPASASGGKLLRTSMRKFDVIIAGSGIAGLLLACEMSSRGLRSLLLCKGVLADSNTSRAQGGLAAVTGDNPFDSPEQHLNDTLKSGAGLTDPAVAKLMVEDGARLTARLEELGVTFDRSNNKRDLAREGGHSHSRVLHSKDSSGRAITSALIELIHQSPRLTVRENCFISELLVYEGRCAGVRVLGDDGVTADILATHIVLATGGLGCVYERTTNPAVATGDGVAMAYRAGAKLADMEFVQFHPTSLAIPNQSTFLISEAVRGAGAVLLDRNKERFAFRYCKDGELATRDQVARAIHSTMLLERRDHVELDLRPIGSGKIAEKFPAIVEACRQRGIDPLTQPLPVAPAAHYFMGGILTDMHGRTTIPGLYAIGECASTGLHGANRLASNSLLEGGVMALRLADYLAGASPLPYPWRNRRFESDVILTTRDCTADRILSFRKKMNNVAGLVRSGESLAEFALNRTGPLLLPVAARKVEVEAANIGLLGGLIVQAAQNRRESRGSHWRVDFPDTDNVKYMRRFLLSLSGTEWMHVQEAVLEVPSA